MDGGGLMRIDGWGRMKEGWRMMDEWGRMDDDGWMRKK